MQRGSHQDLHRPADCPGTAGAVPERLPHPARTAMGHPGCPGTGIYFRAQAQAAAKVLAKMDHTIFIGRGFDPSTAWEISLKCKELANIQAEPYSSADFLHGPIAIVGQGFPVSLISIGDTFRDELIDLGVTLRARGARLITIGDRMLEGHTARSKTCSSPCPQGCLSGSARSRPSYRGSCWRIT